MRIRLLEFLVINWQVYAKCKLIHERLPMARMWAPRYQVPIIVSSKVLSVTMSISPNLCPSSSKVTGICQAVTKVMPSLRGNSFIRLHI